VSDAGRLRAYDIAALVVASFVLRAPALVSGRWYDPDEAAIAVQAQALLRGRSLYGDIADRKPPLPPFAYEVLFRITGSSDPRWPRLLVAALLAGATVVLADDMCRRHGRRVALWTAAIYLLGCLAFAPGDAAAANYAHLALPIATVALVWSRRSGVRWSLLAGLALGVAVLSRQSWIFALPAGALSCWLATRTKGVLAFTAAMGAAVASVALLVSWSDFWFWNVESSPGFFTPVGIGRAAGPFVVAAGLFVAWHLVLVASAAASGRPWRTDRIDLWVWVATGFLAIIGGFRFYGHYWLQIVPPLAILAGPVVAAATAHRRALAAWSMGLTAALAWVLLFVPDLGHPRPDARPMALYLRQHTTGSDSVFVWGTYPELYALTDRPVAGGLVHTDFVTGRTGGWSLDSLVTPGAGERMMRDLEAHPPAVIVDTSAVEHLDYGAYPLASDPPLGAFVQARYTPEPWGDGFVLWWLRG
jgi:4-amino-4-deoxy-L-arabinose transferase-like glycosyltransferase